MSYGEAKIYFDGSHYIAIPHTERPSKRRPKPFEEVITVIPEKEEESASVEEVDAPSLCMDNEQPEEQVEEVKDDSKNDKEGRKATKKELFNELYQKYINEKKKVRKELIIEAMLPYFTNREFCKIFVDTNFERKQRNLICRRVRMCRKANLQRFNYFCTFTYDNKLHNEDSFRKSLKITFRNFCNRKGWKYMGVWERAPKTQRLHFHGLFYIPNGTMPGTVLPFRDYSFITRQMQITYQNTYFNERFGRSDFEEIDNRNRIGEAMTYLMKYIEKTGEKIVYSKGLYQYFISDIMDEDVVTTIGQEDKKLLLFDDFSCWDEGVFMGTVSHEVIQQMRKCN